MHAVNMMDGKCLFLLLVYWEVTKITKIGRSTGCTVPLLHIHIIDKTATYKPAYSLKSK
jgi:hypothetical protein